MVSLNMSIEKGEIAPMSTITSELLYHLHLFMIEGRTEKVLAALEQVSASDPHQQQEIAYVRAWCATSRGCWDAAAPFLLAADSAEQAQKALQALGQTERRRRIHYLLLLGQIADELGYYEEATGHYMQCLAYLDERRMNIPAVRIKVRCGLGAIYVRTGFYAVALTHYADALRLSGADTTHPSALEINAGLYEVHRGLGNFEQALVHGKKVLCLYEERADVCQQTHWHNLLGRVCSQMHVFPQAAMHYTSALDLARHVDSPALIFTNLTALAAAHLEEGLVEAARDAYERALVYQTDRADAQSMGMLHLVGGKIAEATAGQATGARARALLDEALACYQQAEAIFRPLQSRAELVEVYGRLARLLESFGRQSEALACWKSAYTMYDRPEESLAF